MKPAAVVWRLTAAITAVSMALGHAAPAYAVPPPIAPSQASPPGRVGRLARISGSVSFHTADQTEWSPAVLNYPVTTGNALWTEASAEALVEVSGNRLAMDGTTEFDIAALDDHALVGSTPQGSLYLNLRSVPNGDTYTIQTPRGAVQIISVGRYEVVAGDIDHPTTITVVSGAAQITGTNLALQVGAGQMASIDGSTVLQGAVGPIRQDAFLTRMLAEERPPARSAVAIPAVVSQMTGYEDLDQYGAWSDTPQNGAIWYPKVESGWVPYRHGHWSYVAPWGWTWIDDAAWGFAPFHYGRWVQNDDRWGWIPSDPGLQSYPQPVYAPALIRWFGVGAGVAVGAGVLATRDRSVGWVPLGPNEPYYPSYSHSVNYVRQMNGGNVRNVTQIITDNSVRVNFDDHSVVQNFINRGGATVVPAAVMAQSAPIAPAARGMTPEQFAQARAQVRAPIQPTAATAGVTPRVARQFNFVPAARTSVAGPPIDPAAFRGASVRGGTAFVPPLRAAGGTRPSPRGEVVPTEARPGDAAHPAASPGIMQPGGAPALHQAPAEVRPGPAPAAPGATSRIEDPAHPGAVSGAGQPGVLPALRPAPAGSRHVEAPATTPQAGSPVAPRAEMARPYQAAPEPARTGAQPPRPASAMPVQPAPGLQTRPDPQVRATAPHVAAEQAPRPAPPATPRPTPQVPRPVGQAPRPAPQAPRPAQQEYHPAPQETRPAPQAPHPVQAAAPQPRPPQAHPAPAPHPGPQPHHAPAGHPPGHEEHH